MDDRRRQGVGWTKILGWVLILAAFWYIGRWLRDVDPVVWTYVRSMDRSTLLISLVIFQAWFAFRFLGWEMISRRFGLADVRTSNLKMWTLSELMRYVPGNVWSFAARYKGARDRGTSKSGAVASLATEAVLLMIGAAIIAAVFWRWTWWPLWLVGTVVTVILLPWMIQLIGQWRKWDKSIGITMVDSLRLVLLYTVVWLVYGLAQATMIRAIPGLDLPSLGTLVGINVLAWLAGYVSILTPMGLGVREVAFVKLLGSTAAGTASLLAVITRVWLIVAEVVFLGLVMIFSRRK